MSAKTKILVVKMRELIYTAIFLALIILLIVLLVAMFSSDDAGEPERAGKKHRAGSRPFRGHAGR